MIKKIVFLIGIVFLSVSAFANEKQIVKDLFLNKIDEVTNIISDRGLSKEDRNSKVVQVLDPIFDFEIMAKISLGKKWSTLSSDEKSQFILLYVERIKHSYSSKLDQYGGETFEVINIEQPKTNRIQLVTNLVSTEKTFEVSYKFYKPKSQKENKNSWLIYDVEILGVSILKTDRAQFKEYLQTHSVNELMVELSKNNS